MEGIALSILRASPSLALIALGFFVGLRVLRFPDLTCDASFAAGMVGFAVGLRVFDSSVFGALLAVVLGCLAGGITGLLFSAHPTGVFKILSSVLVMFGFYSINFRLLGRTNARGFYDEDYLFNRIMDAESVAHPWRPLTYIASWAIVIGVTCITVWFFRTHVGSRIRAAGWYPSLVTESGRPFRVYVVCGLMIGNAIIAVGGWLHAAVSSSVDLQNRGVVIEAIAAVLLGELLLDFSGRLRDRRVNLQVAVLGPLIGAIVYVSLRAVANFILRDQMKVFIQTDRYVLIAGIIFLAVLIARAGSIRFIDAAGDETM